MRSINFIISLIVLQSKSISKVYTNPENMNSSYNTKLFFGNVIKINILSSHKSIALCFLTSVL